MGEAKRVIGIFLDGYEPSLEAEMRASGELPHLASLIARGSVAQLEHGPAQRTGLAGEHLSTGRSPDAAGRHAAVDFDPQRYLTRQRPTDLPTFVEHLHAPTVVFDVPYFDLEGTTNAQGVVNWGAHDPGVASSSRPDTLLDELRGRFGAYPATEFLYRTPWASEDECKVMGDSLASAADVRTNASLWLLREKLSDWQFALVSVSEPHSAIEGLWHGIDPAHRLAHLPSARAAGEGVRSVYRAVDRLVGAHLDAFHDATVVVFSMHGMGSNTSDIASMALLPELLYRSATGKTRLGVPASWAADPATAPMRDPGSTWERAIRDRCAIGPRASLMAGLGRRARRTTRRLRGDQPTSTGPLAWMPATQYSDAWPTMPAFALPSYYDGRVRVNLIGRERRGIVALERYDQVLDELATLLEECTDPATGAPAVDFVERIASDRGVDPRTLGESDADLVVVWTGPLALQHPELGLIGPLPFRRTGGHSAPFGSVAIAGPGIPRRHLGRASSFDIVPTFFDLLGEKVPEEISGRPLALR